MHEVVEVQIAFLLVAEDAPHDEEALLCVVWAAEADEAQRARAIEQLRDSELGEVRLQLRVITQEFSRSVQSKKVCTGITRTCGSTPPKHTVFCV